MDATTDAEVFAHVAPTADPQWRTLFGMGLWSQPGAAADEDIHPMVDCMYRLGLVVPFDWPDWYRADRFPGGQGLESAPAADAVRLVTSFVRGDRFSEGALKAGLADGSISAAIERLWQWYRAAVAGTQEFVDHADYSPDAVYRWSYERRWAPGAALCWVGLNPATGDSDGGPRPTLRKVVAWAKREGCASVVVVNLFSFRSTDPKALRRGGFDIVGERTNEIIKNASWTALATLAAWGADKAAERRSAEVFDLLDNPMCAGLTKSGQPRHPLYVPQSTVLVPYRPRRP